jgi:cyclopropane fatty-acyl-phospholipid synthase-like methyltransferase
VGVHDVPDVAAIVRDGYDQIADQYLAAVAPARADDQRDAWTEQLLQRLAPASTVLDLGCGPGVPSAAMLEAAGHHVVGVDISPRQIELARRNVPSGSFVVCDVVDFTAEPASFDAAMALYSLTHVPRDRYPALFARLVEWLRPGAWLLASMGATDAAGWNEEDFLGFGHTSWTNGCDPATSRRLLTDAGFDLERAEMVQGATPFGAERWLWILARRASPS